jgi:hypothetical protein
MIKKLLGAGISVSKGMGSISGNTIRIGTMGVINNFYIAKFLNTYFKLRGIDKIINIDEVPEATKLPDFLLNDINLA